MARTVTSGVKAKITLPPRPSNAGGAVRGQARAAQVRAANATRKAAPAIVKSAPDTSTLNDNAKSAPDTSTLNNSRLLRPVSQQPSGGTSLPDSGKTAPNKPTIGRMAAMPMVRPASSSARSNSGGATRGKARAAQVQAMNKPKGPGPTPSAANAMRGRRYEVAQRRIRATYGKNYSPPAQAASASAPAAKRRSAGFNPFGVPAGTVLDAIIASKRKR